VLWFGTTLAGFRAIRQRRFADHRQWMLRSAALAFSIVAYRVWLIIAFAVFVPEVYTGAEVDPAALDEAIGLTSWVSWVVNLLIVEWWLHRRPAVAAEEPFGEWPEPGQRRSCRMRTRGNPPDTDLVSAAFTKPASSKSFRVPT
jgi:hypothetical protein